MPSKRVGDLLVPAERWLHRPIIPTAVGADKGGRAPGMPWRRAAMLAMMISTRMGQEAVTVTRISKTDEGAWPPGLAYFRVGAGAPLLFLPGLSGEPDTPSGLDLTLQLHLLTPFARSRELIWLNRRRGLAPPATMAQIAADFATVIRERLPPPVDVIGVSTGGSVALQLAVDHPELVRRLVVVSAAHRLSDNGLRVQREIAAAVRSGRPRRAGAVGVAAMAATGLGALVLGAGGWVMGRRTFGNAGPDLLAMLDAEDDFDLQPQLGRITASTLVIGAEKDRYYTPRLFRDTAAGIPDARLILYPRIGHMGTTLQRRFPRDVLSFLEA
ncbi:alpha/beta hydrolase [Microbacterium sp. zg-YB36]|uniref:alpha/beta fold hydrolase n=1 Tax=Microbacterium sp. zg-YB36 TaxID=2969407 RepID=UPI00214C24FD|nr:alpha/beta hydrolase [Microbacterium sp. zg-YB36]MDL5353172.1 alpha/beta hydrolase [Microbacterium sp. zg-YB36]